MNPCFEINFFGDIFLKTKCLLLAQVQSQRITCLFCIWMQHLRLILLLTLPCHVFLNGFVKRGTDNPLITHTDHCALLIYLSPYVCLSFLISPSLPFLPSSLSCSYPAVRTTATSPLSPPAGVWLVIPVGCWGSSQSCQWGSPPGWPRHTVVQVRKQATQPNKHRWERWERWERWGRWGRWGLWVPTGTRRFRSSLTPDTNDE